MIDYFLRLFDTSDFPARWSCGNWSAAHGWLHILSDLAIFGAYAAIPLTIAFFVARRPDVTFPKLYWLFAAFILSCGFTHLIEATIFWQPWYRFSGAVKLTTAVISWATVFALIRIVPSALHLPGIGQLNQQLSSEADERKSAEEEVIRLNAALRHRVEELETLLNVLPVGIAITTDATSRDIRTNPAFAEMLGLHTDANASLSAGDGEGPTNFRVFQNGDELDPEDLPIQRVARTGEEIRNFEEEIVFNDGRRLHVLAYASPLRRADQSIRGAVGAFIDITGRKEAETGRRAIELQLEETRKLESLGLLAGGIAHDFNNLLTTIMGHASLVHLQLPKESPIQQSVRHIEEASTRAADLCRQMLAYAGKGKLSPGPVDIHEIIAETLHVLKASIGQEIVLQVEAGESVPRMMADPGHMQLMVLNLAVNASEAIGDSAGRITLKTGHSFVSDEDAANCTFPTDMAKGEFVFLEVTDTGRGMSAETVAQIFDPFFTTKFLGRGLGLAAVQGIIRSHQGCLHVDSEEGHGTTFRVFIPACGEDA